MVQVMVEEGWVMEVVVVRGMVQGMEEEGWVVEVVGWVMVQVRVEEG
jgi:hypothetical protein